MAIAALRFRRLTEASDDAGHAHEGEGEGESLIDLSDLVASFLEREGVMRGGGGDGEGEEEEMRREDSKSIRWSDPETTKDKLLALFRGCADDGNAVSSDVKRKIRTEVEAAWGSVTKNGFSEGLKRQSVISLHLKGFDAGLYKSNWGKASSDGDDDVLVVLNEKGLEGVKGEGLGVRSANLQEGEEAVAVDVDGLCYEDKEEGAGSGWRLLLRRRRRRERERKREREMEKKEKNMQTRKEKRKMKLKH